MMQAAPKAVSAVTQSATKGLLSTMQSSRRVCLLDPNDLKIEGGLQLWMCHMSFVHSQPYI